MKNALERIRNDYESHHEFARLNLRFASSEELKELIKGGNACDVFIPSGSEYLDGLNIVEASKMNIAQKDGVIYPAAVMSSSRNEKPSMRFAGCFTNSTAKEILRAENFSPAQSPANRPPKDKTKNKTKQK